MRAGLTFSNINVDADGADVEFNSRTGFVVGIPVEIRLPGPLGLQVEANYSQYGAKADFAGFETDDVINYLDIPVLLKAGLISDDFEASAVVGPSFGYALSGKSTFNGETEDIEFGDDDVRANIGLVFGAQGGLPVGAGKITLDVRYNLGLNDLEDDDDDIKITNRQFQVALGYLFTIGG